MSDQVSSNTAKQISRLVPAEVVQQALKRLKNNYGLRFGHEYAINQKIAFSTIIRQRFFLKV
jgi:hypothetical protein